MKNKFDSIQIYFLYFLCPFYKGLRGINFAKIILGTIWVQKKEFKNVSLKKSAESGKNLQ